VTARDTRFWTNVALVTVAHLVVLLALARGNREEPQANLQNVVWMSADAAAATEPKHTPAPTPVSTVAPIEKPVESASQTPFKSEIQMPSPTPTPTAVPKPSPTPSPTPKSSAKPSPSPTPKPTPKKNAEPKATPKPASKSTQEKKPAATASASKKESSSSTNQSSEKKPGADKGSSSTTAQPSELAWYGTMLHDRFHKAWDQPKSIVAAGVKMSTLVKIRIEKDGKVSKFTIVKPSGNVVVDESVSAIAQRVTQVDPLPEGLTQKNYYEVKIDFELNAEK
jgi:TonB family protein